VEGAAEAGAAMKAKIARAMANRIGELPAGRRKVVLIGNANSTTKFP
jgi:hypothetical protein